MGAIRREHTLMPGQLVSLHRDCGQFGNSCMQNTCPELVPVYRKAGKEVPLGVMGIGHWRKRLHGGHLQGRKSQPEAQLAFWALGGSAGSRGSPFPPVVVKDRVEPKAEGPCPTLPSSPPALTLVSPEGAWKAGLPINSSLSQASDLRLGSALCPPPLPGSEQSLGGTTSTLENHSSPCDPSSSIGRTASPAVLSLAGGEH